MEGFIHNLNTMHSRGGNQVVFSSINYGTDTSAEGRMVIQELLKATIEGLGNHGEVPVFPIQIFKVKDGVSYSEADYQLAMKDFEAALSGEVKFECPNFDLFLQACRTTAKALFPNFMFLDTPFNKHEKWSADDPKRYRMDADYLRKPRKWDASDISRFMIFIGPISSIFDIVTYLVMWYVFSCNSVEHQTLFQSGWFIEGLLSQTLIVHMIRTQKIPFIQSCASWQVTGLTVLIMVIGIIIPFSPFGTSIGLEPLPLSYFPWLVGILLSYCVLTQMIKNWYIKRFVKWL